MAPKMHQINLNAKLERITDEPAAASIPHDKNNSTTESFLATLLARSRGVVLARMHQILTRTRERAGIVV
jgi:hypothetical protein